MPRNLGRNRGWEGFGLWSTRSGKAAQYAERRLSRNPRGRESIMYHTLACDYDNTLASNSAVDAATLAALRRWRETGRRLLLVTGRELDDLLRVFPQLDLFALVV